MQNANTFQLCAQSTYPGLRRWTLPLYSYRLCSADLRNIDHVWCICQQITWKEYFSMWFSVFWVSLCHIDVVSYLYGESLTPLFVLSRERCVLWNVLCVSVLNTYTPTIYWFITVTLCFTLTDRGRRPSTRRFGSARVSVTFCKRIFFLFTSISPQFSFVCTAQRHKFHGRAILPTTAETIHKNLPPPLTPPSGEWRPRPPPYCLISQW